MDKFPKPEDDSYREYLIAVAKEAQAYDLTREFNDSTSGKRPDIKPQDAEDDFQRAQKLLDEAGAIYKEIIGENPKEKEFRPATRAPKRPSPSTPRSSAIATKTPRPRGNRSRLR